MAKKILDNNIILLVGCLLLGELPALVFPLAFVLINFVYQAYQV